MQKTLLHANRVHNETRTTIIENKQVITKMDEEEKLFSENIAKHKEETCNKQNEKYQNKPQRIVEPNLSKLRENRKQKAILAAQQAAQKKAIQKAMQAVMLSSEQPLELL